MTKSGKIDFNLYANLTGDYTTVIEDIVGNWTKENHSIPISLTFTKKLKSWYLLPEFSKPEITKGEIPSERNVHIDVSRDLIIPVTLGMGLYDDNDQKELDKYYYTEQIYWQNTLWYGNLEHTFKDLRPIAHFAG